MGSTTETRKQGDGTEGRRHPRASGAGHRMSRTCSVGARRGWRREAGPPDAEGPVHRAAVLKQTGERGCDTAPTTPRLQRERAAFQGSSLQTLLPRDVLLSRTRGQTGVPGLGQSPRAGGHQRQDSCRDVQVPGGQWSLLPLGRVTELCTVPCSGPGGVGPASTRENVRLARELQGQCPGGTDPPAPLPPAPSPYGLLPDPPTVKLATSGSLTPGCSSPCLPKTDVLFKPRFRTTDVYPGCNIMT